ncbi:alpha/beta fold hydrolase [Undibacterium cyanobacteriorum]|uniref:Alpha/beta fold hydrolase n=1 Tax=Undibacterium cyanobacteriorum TaxID=3073561 RepID=A0ABY9RHJ6_9BURK|nr:prolyl oligopeptidase family serine peptidase [Undibacterium sp. 20NA77.5]WMW80707.1 alpha/beta fold hydrolase [Undibacterium sp. 20NA77.5]
MNAVSPLVSCLKIFSLQHGRRWLLSLAISGVAVFHQAYAIDGKYQLPPAELQALVDAPRGPEFKLGPQNKQALLISLPNLPSISEVSQPELRLAGLRINPKMRAASRVNFSDGLSLLDLNTGKMRKVQGLPAKVKIADTVWSEDEDWVAFSVWGKNGVELWLLDVEEARARRLIYERLNATTGAGFSWLNGSEELLVRLLPRQQKTMPFNLSLPDGPATQESRGGKLSQNRTFQDLLRTPRDADMLDWQLQTQLAVVNVNGTVRRFGPNMVLSRAQASPDGKLVLLSQLRRPYSYQVPMERFAQSVEVWTLQGKKLKTIAEQAMRERMPNGVDAVQAGPRGFAWRNDEPATLYWLEAQEGGDPEVHSRVHDVMVQQAAPFSAPPQKLIELPWRFSSVQWGNDNLALVTETWAKTRDTRTWRIHPGAPLIKPELIFSRKTEDQYANPGVPVMSLNQFGRSVIRTTPDGQYIFLTGTGASPEGDRPFLDKLHLATEKTTRLWRSKAPYYEEVLGILDDNGTQIITSRESVDERPNLYIRNLLAGPNVKASALTAFPHPTPQMKGIQKRSLRYEREDGVELSATLYLPPGYEPKRDGPRPMLMWAYPREFKSAEAASQVSGSPYRFNRINVQGPMVMLARGYTVLDGPTMPIIGEGRREPNDTFVEQLKMDAEAAVDEVVRLGVADRNRIAIGGHSYGAFMAANLLAHTNLFRAGIARSGAYNRTLTPFGFQSEDRTYWRAKETYLEMSPFHFADEIDEALLLIHGEDDNNPGTYPLQSERMYQALAGLGTPTRLVMLPNESHIYRARESILHMLWEQDQWMSRYVKNAKPASNR